MNAEYVAVWKYMCTMIYIHYTNFTTGVYWQKRMTLGVNFADLYFLSTFKKGGGISMLTGPPFSIATLTSLVFNDFKYVSELTALPL